MKEIKDIFKVGDRVFHIQNGWGTVGYSPKQNYYLVDFDNNSTAFWYTKFNNKVLSFTEYTLEGFSQERPEELPYVGQVVWVRKIFPSEWIIGHFREKKKDRYYISSCNNEYNDFGFEIRTTNPYANEQ